MLYRLIDMIRNCINGKRPFCRLIGSRRSGFRSKIGSLTKYFSGIFREWQEKCDISLFGPSFAKHLVVAS